MKHKSIYFSPCSETIVFAPLNALMGASRQNISGNIQDGDPLDDNEPH